MQKAYIQAMPKIIVVRKEVIKMDYEHDIRVIGGIKVYVGGSNPAWLNNLARALKQKPFPVSRSKAIKLPKGYGAWILPDKQGFSAMHIYVHCTTVKQLEEVVKTLEKEVEDFEKRAFE